MCPNHLPWVLWRQDDNGIRFEVSRHASQEAAEKAKQRLEFPPHKQLYEVLYEESQTLG